MTSGEREEDCFASRVQLSMCSQEKIFGKMENVTESYHRLRKDVDKCEKNEHISYFANGGSNPIQSFSGGSAYL